MLTPQGVLNTGRGSLDTALRIGQRLTTLKLEEATAAEPRRLHGSAFEVWGSCGPGGGEWTTGYNVNRIQPLDKGCV